MLYLLGMKPFQVSKLIFITKYRIHLQLTMKSEILSEEKILVSFINSPIHVMVIVVGNEYGDTSSNPGRD